MRTKKINFHPLRLDQLAQRYSNVLLDTCALERFLPKKKIIAILTMN